jgi:phage recombination protein Bet
MGEVTTVAAGGGTPARVRLSAKLAARFHVEPGMLMESLKQTAFRQREGVVITDEQMVALLVIADQYGLNPFTKEIFAFEDKGGIVPVVSVDGWLRIINSHPQMNGLEFRWADESVTLPGGKPCPAWCEVVIRRKDRDEPIIVREFLDEVYVPPRTGKSKFKQGETYEVAGPWQTHTKRMLRHKTLIQGSRVAFGFAGIYDEDEAGRILEAARQPDGGFEVQGQRAQAPAAAAPAAGAAVDRETGEIVEGGSGGGEGPGYDDSWLDEQPPM